MDEKNNIKLDQFFTKPLEAKRLYEVVSKHVDLKEYDIIYEPSVGANSFGAFFPQKKAVRMDIDPKENVFWYNEKEDKIYAVPICDIPISLKHYGDWFLNSVVRTKRTTLTFNQFVIEMCTKLVVGALNPNVYAGRPKVKKPKLSISTFLMKDSPNRPISPGRFPVDNLSNKGVIQSTNLIKNTSQFLFLHIAGATNKHLKGKKSLDESDGIFHLFVGSDSGLVKNINFKRTDLPFQREANIEKSKDRAKTSLLYSDHYHADVRMIGNPIFKPGMLVYINPRAMGIGSPTTANSHATKMGIGGYYVVTKVDCIIESGKFETNLHLVFQGRLQDFNKIERSVARIDPVPPTVSPKGDYKEYSQEEFSRWAACKHFPDGSEARKECEKAWDEGEGWARGGRRPD